MNNKFKLALLLTSLFSTAVLAVTPPPGIVSNTPGSLSTLTVTLGSITSNYTVAGPPTQYGQINTTGTFNWPIGAGGGCCRLRNWLDTVNVTGNQAGANVIESNFYDLEITGTGTLTGEAFNIVHPFVNIGAGVTISGGAEIFEASATNSGNISGVLSGSLNIFTNNSAGIANFTAYKTSIVNNNVTAGSMPNYTGFECSGVTGSGSAPTFNWCMVNRDSTASIVTVGGVRIGGLGNSNGPGTLAIYGPDTAAGTFPLFIKSSTSNLFYVADDGSTTVGLGQLSLGAGTSWGKLLFNNTTSGQLQLSAPSSGALSGVLTLPNTTGTLAIAPLSSTSASIGGGALGAGACATTATTVTGAAVGMAVVATPNTYPGAGNVWNSYVSAGNTVTTQICAIVAATPTASTYNVRVMQ